MKSLLKFLGLAAVIVLVGLWIMTVSKSCNKNKVAETTNIGAAAADKVTELKDDAESLFEGEPEEEGLFNEEGDELDANGAEGTDEEEDHDEGDDEGDDEGNDEGDDEEESDLQAEIAARKNASTSAGSGSGSTSTASGSGNMEYLVIGGAFITEANAKAEVKRLKKKGYADAEVVTFDFSQYHSVCVKRTSSRSDARAVKNKLVKDGNTEAYVHKKRKYLKKK